jgi:hypothetical protein
LKNVFNEEDTLRKKAITTLESSIHENEIRLRNLQNHYLDGKISSFEEYVNLKSVIDLRLFNDRKNMKTLKEVSSPYDEFLNLQVPFLEDLMEFYQRSNGKMKAKILGCIFSEKVEILEGKNTTTPIAEPFSLLLNIGAGLKRVKKEKEVNYDLFHTWAPRVDPKYNHQPMIDFVILYKSSGKT